MLLHATALVDVVNKSTIPAKDLNIDRDGDRHVGGTAFSVIISEDDKYNGEATLLSEFRWTSRHKKDHPSRPPPSEAINYLAKLVYLAITNKGVSVSGVTLHCFMEHKCKGFIFRAHPNYRHEGPWHDWVYYQYTQMGVQGKLEIPAQIWCFVDLRSPIMVSGPDGEECNLRNHLEGWMGDDGVYAVCTSMYAQPVTLVVSNATHCESSKWQHTGKGDKEKEDERTHSVILECGKRDKELMLLPTASFSRPAMVIDNAGHSSDHNKSLIVVKPRSFWPSEFV